jgi:hypothetical protein
VFFRNLIFTTFFNLHNLYDRLECGREIVEDEYANDEEREEANQKCNEALRLFKQAIQYHALKEIATSLQELRKLCEQNRHMDGSKVASAVIAEYYPNIYQEIIRNAQNNLDVADPVVPLGDHVDSIGKDSEFCIHHYNN